MPLPSGATQNPYGPLVNFQTVDVLPPSAVYIGPTDNLFLQFLIPTQVTQNITLTYRILKPDGTIVTTNDNFLTPTVQTFNNVIFIPAQEGFLLSLVVRGNNVLSRGQVFVRVFINTGSGLVADKLSHLLCQGYTSQIDAVSFPQSPLEGSLNGRGWLRTLSQAAVNQAPNIFTVPNNVHWKIKAINLTYSASAVVANRQPFVACNDAGGNQLFFQLAPFVVPANNIGQLAASAGLTQAVNGTTASVGLGEDFILTPGFTVSGNALAISAGDQVGPMIITVEEFVGQ